MNIYDIYCLVYGYIVYMSIINYFATTWNIYILPVVFIYMQFLCNVKKATNENYWHCFLLTCAIQNSPFTFSFTLTTYQCQTIKARS